MQNCKYNLQVRKTIENILENYTGDRSSAEFAQFETYAKRVFFSNGIHHHYAEDKFFPECSKEYFAGLMASVNAWDEELLDVIYNPSVYKQRKSTDKTGDIVAESAVNFYEG
jgi:dipeptidyl-peptidase-3